MIPFSQEYLGALVTAAPSIQHQMAPPANPGVSKIRSHCSNSPKPRPKEWAYSV